MSHEEEVSRASCVGSLNSPLLRSFLLAKNIEQMDAHYKSENTVTIKIEDNACQNIENGKNDTTVIDDQSVLCTDGNSYTDVKILSCNQVVDLPKSDQREELAASGTDIEELPSSDADVEEYNPSNTDDDDDDEIESDSARESDPKSKKCHLCDKVLSSRNGLLKHMRNIHRDGSGFACRVCKKSFPSNNALRAHNKRSHKLLPKESSHCKNCNKAYDSRQQLHLHKKRCFRRSFCKLFIGLGLELCKTSRSVACNCKICGQRFNSVYELREHGMNYHEGKVFACEICGESFLLPDTLRCHVNIHLEDKAFPLIVSV